MQRLARTPLNSQNQKAITLYQQFKSLKQHLVHHLPASTLQLLAEPMIKNDVVEWYSALEGQPQQITELAQITRFQPQIKIKLTYIQQVLEELQNMGKISEEIATPMLLLLQEAKVSQPQIYLINNEPVLIGWGDLLQEKTVPSATSTVTPLIAHTTAPTYVGFFAKHRWCCWLLPFLLLLLLSLLWWWFNRPLSPLTEPKVEETEVVQLQPELEPQIVPSQPAPIIEPQAEAVHPVVEPEFVSVESEQPISEPMPVVEPSKKVEPLCEKIVSPEKRPQMVIVFDNSPSMNIYAGITNEEEERLYNEMEYMSPNAYNQARDYLIRSPSRLNVAKKAASRVIDNIAPNVDIGLVVLESCPARNMGFFAPNKRKKLKGTLKQLNSLDKGSTALYDGVRKAMNMVDGVSRDAFILVLSDGRDTCDEDKNICSLVKDIAQRKPKLKINVVDIGKARAANCLATVTGGKVFTATDSSALSKMINQASMPMEEKMVCKAK